MKQRALHQHCTACTLEGHFCLERCKLVFLRGGGGGGVRDGACGHGGEVQARHGVLLGPGRRGRHRWLHQLPVQFLRLQLLQLRVQVVLVDLRREADRLAQRVVDLPQVLRLLRDLLHCLVYVVYVGLLLELLHRLGARAHRRDRLGRGLGALKHDLLVVDPQLLVRDLVRLGLVHLLPLQALQGSPLVLHLRVLLRFPDLVRHLLL
mmetsp:Transcript_4543/g.10848  ORF Transcript_4543/g.10848 Transcript_4543/m.10848 type:complete len:207 (-) Transcript_4543:388-1008(-)